jgi:ribosome-binding factor A
MAKHRVPRLNEQLRREITEIVRQQLRDPRIGAVTITEVRITPDLDFARVFITTLSEGAEREETIAGLHAAAPFIRSELGRRLRIRHTPELRFELDESLERARRIEALLAQVRAPEPTEPPEPPEPAEPPEEGSRDGPERDDVA